MVIENSVKYIRGGNWIWALKLTRPRKPNTYWPQSRGHNEEQRVDRECVCYQLYMTVTVAAAKVPHRVNAYCYWFAKVSFGR